MQPFVEGYGLIRALFLNGQAECGRNAPDVHVIQVLHFRARQETQQDGAGDRVDVRQLPRLAAVGNVKLVHLLRGELRQEFSEFLTQDQVRLHLLVGLGVEVWEVDRVADFSGQQISRDYFGYFDAALLLCFRRARAEVWRERNTGVLAEWVVFRQRFL